MKLLNLPDLQDFKDAKPISKDFRKVFTRIAINFDSSALRLLIVQSFIHKPQNFKEKSS